MAKQRTYSKYAQEAALSLGKQIKLGRKQHKWSEKYLAERVGGSRVTLQKKIENGGMTCAIGLVFEVATLFWQIAFSLNMRRNRKGAIFFCLYRLSNTGKREDEPTHLRLT